ncbi:hypothetical protein DAEQUDRAFT_770481 [Daedalea quercina L-15889]|uniref:Uncharacterized protein n=1 Tax=Daedalea quercina L-15889 TaxID=1314783 RepID=A0A165KU98_9APHY|nr:hypothetical protein DAEQUDRAFT_770481 [Daedalea quercina L-15889]
MPSQGPRTTGSAASGAKTTLSDAARIQAGQAKAGGDMGKGGFAARAQGAAARNAAAGAASPATPNSAAGAKAGKGSK